MYFRCFARHCPVPVIVRPCLRTCIQMYGKTDVMELCGETVGSCFETFRGRITALFDELPFGESRFGCALLWACAVASASSFRRRFSAERLVFSSRSAATYV